MFSMSAGLRSAMRLVGWSWLVEMPVALAPVREFMPVPICELLTSTPSITYRGLALALIEVTPRSCTCEPPPGAPELVEMTAPGILPWSAFSIVGVGALLSCSPLTCAIELAALALDTLVVVPVMTCVSSCRTSFTMVTST